MHLSVGSVSVFAVTPNTASGTRFNHHHPFSVMDVTFAASGAINRAHYAIVQKVENANDPGLADDAIIQEIDTIRARFQRPAFSAVTVG